MPDWMKHKLESRVMGEISVISDSRWHHPFGTKWRRTKEPLDESERGEWKSWLKNQHSTNEDHGIWSHHFTANRWETMEPVTDFTSLGSKIIADSDCSHEIKRYFLLGRKVMTNLDSILKSRVITLPTNVHLIKDMVFPLVMYGCDSWDYKENWTPKNWCFWTVVLEKTLERPFDCKEIQPVNPKGNQSWIFFRRTDAKAEIPILWPPDAKNRQLEKTLMLGKIEGGRRTGWQRMRWSYGITNVMDMSLSKLQELGDGQGSLVCCSPWGHKELDTTEQLNWLEHLFLTVSLALITKPQHWRC